MKKLSLLILALILVFVSCQQDPIFYDISQEIELNKPSIGGKVVAIKKAEKSLYAINGNLNYKSFDEKRWRKIRSSGEISSVAIGNDIIYILDGNTVYSATLDEDGKVNSLWDECATEVSRLFDNQAKELDKKNVYIVKNGELINMDSNSDLGTSQFVDGTEAKNVVAALYLDGVDYFFGTTACAVSENNFYYASGAEIKCGDSSSSLNTVSTNLSATSMTIFENNLYVGTNSGAFVASIAGSPTSLDFSYLSGNAESAFGDREILGIWNFDGKDNFFVSVTSASSSLYDALWGYDSSIDKWNLE